MMFWNISIDEFFNFFLGMAIGLIIFIVVFIVLTVRGKLLDPKKVKRSTVDVDEAKLKQIIAKKVNELKHNKLVDEKNIFKQTVKMSHELVEEIAAYFFPESKYPMYELNSYELLALNQRINARIYRFLNKPGLRLVLKLQLIKIKDFLDKNEIAKQKKTTKAVKKVNKVTKVTKVKMIVTNHAQEAAVNVFFGFVVWLVGDEITQAYSKKRFGEKIELDLTSTQKATETVLKKLVLKWMEKTNKKDK